MSIHDAAPCEPVIPSARPLLIAPPPHVEQDERRAGAARSRKHRAGDTREIVIPEGYSREFSIQLMVPAADTALRQ